MNKQPPELDPELRRLFVEEAEQKATEISKGIAEFNGVDRDSPQALDRMVWLQMRFAEYSGIASTLGLQRSGRACALAVDELTQVIGKAREADDSLPSLFDAALESIDDALEYLHGEDIDPSRIYDPDDHEPTVAAKLPALDFPQIKQATGNTQAQAPTSIAASAQLQQPVPKGIDSSLYEIFMDEAEELLALAEGAWSDWQQQQNQHDAISELRRVFHTLKGGARLTQMMVLGDYLHTAEDWMQEADEPAKIDGIKSKTRQTLDQLTDIFGALKNQKTAVFADHGDASAKAPAAIAEAVAETKPAPEQSRQTSKASGNARTYVRVRTQTLEALRLRAGEVNALRNQIQQIATALQTEQALTSQTLQEASSTLRNGRFALERLIDKLPKQENELLNDAQLESQMALQQLDDVILRLNRQNDRSSDLYSHVERALQGQSKAGFALQENILNTRLVPFSDYQSRLKRIVQQTAAESGNKKVELDIDGVNTDVDRRLMEQLLPALEHMLRNAVVHGIEDEAQRRQQGKAVVGKIRLAIRKSRGKLEVDLADDGAGLALDRIHAKAVTLGIIKADEKLSQRRLERLIFHPGLSAAEQLDQLAGRGVGMDVVEHSVHDLGGNINLLSESGKGTRFQLRLPMGETSLDAVIVHIADELYAVPQDDIRSIQRLDDQTLSRGYQEAVPIAWNGHGWKLRSLGHWLGLGEGRLPGPKQHLPALLVQSENEHYAVVVDYCGDSGEYNLETLPPAVTGILGINAAVILEDGQIAPVLDLPALCNSQMVYQRQSLQLADPDPDQRYRVMIIDDSTTWLRQLTRGLARYPFDLISCKDGQEALSLIEDQMPQLLIVDLEMPRMDGLEFLRRLRRNPKLLNIPAIMFSSVSGSNQRNRARQLGAKAWVSKNTNLRPLMLEIDRQLGSQFARHLSDETA